MIKNKKSLKDILIIHELAFIGLIIIAATAGSIGISRWQTLTQETQRISALVNEVQQTRGDLYRQMKELFDAFFLEDEGARVEYNQFTLSVEQHFKQLKNMAIRTEEQQAIAQLHKNYQQFVTETSFLFDQKATLSTQANKMLIQHALNNGIEKGLFKRYEHLLARTEKLLANQQLELDHQLANTKKISTILLFIPILLAILLLIFSRIFLKQAIVTPMNQMVKATTEISTGNLSFKATEEGVEELVAVSKSINMMAEKLAISQQALVRTEKQAAQGLLVPMLAHNIRNPLASIRATAQILDGPEFDEDTRDSLVGIINTVDRLERWTGALLAYLHPLKPQLAYANLYQIILGACAPLQQKLKEKALTLTLPANDQLNITTDEHLLEQVIYNFVLNAIDASSKGAVIQIDIIESDTHINLHIADHGCGMPFIPDPSAMNSPTTKRFGTGLGIPFGFKVCEALKCQLRFSSSKTEGTVITIEIPKTLNLTLN